MLFDEDYGDLQFLGGGELSFDHAAVVVRVRGEPLVLEASLSGGARLRPFEHRLRRTRSGVLVLRPLARELSAAQAEAARAYALAVAPPPPAGIAEPAAGAFGALDALSALAGGAAALREVAAVLWSADANSSVALVEDFYGALGGGFERRDAAAAGRPLAMRDLAPPQQPWAGEAGRYGRAVFVRDRLV